ncbi:MAG: hypothetical protein HY985_19410 [Magnetospirillum sp.]|nr:hypothetical protein [Magnetospirillum sp.]
MKATDELAVLARMLEIEAIGGAIDRRRAAELASRLAAVHPELRQTLGRVEQRMTQM